jgi:hypothetical protein
MAFCAASSQLTGDWASNSMTFTIDMMDNFYDEYASYHEPHPNHLILVSLARSINH